MQASTLQPVRINNPPPKQNKKKYYIYTNIYNEIVRTIFGN